MAKKSKTTDTFKTIIQDHLNSIANNDLEFRKRLELESKNIDDCITYILNQVQKSGMSGFDDDEIFGMALHYYDEDEIDVGKAVECKIVTNRKPQLTPEEIAKAKQDAIDKRVEEEKQKLIDRDRKKAEIAKKKKEEAKKAKEKQVESGPKDSLFGPGTLFG